MLPMRCWQSLIPAGRCWCSDRISMTPTRTALSSSGPGRGLPSWPRRTMRRDLGIACTGAGLAELLWAGQVEHSEWIADLERQSRVHKLHDSARFARLTHFILPLKDSVVEVAAEDAAVLRLSGSTAGAAAEMLRQ
jgi:hypothetical protein